MTDMDNICDLKYVVTSGTNTYGIQIYITTKTNITQLEANHTVSDRFLCYIKIP